jgi:hypothetical protein
LKRSSKRRLRYLDLITFIWEKPSSQMSTDTKRMLSDLLMIVLRQQMNSDGNQTRGRDRLSVADNVRYSEQRAIFLHTEH